MPQPEFYPEGVTPQIWDTHYRAWVKILGTLQNIPGALAANNPRIGDTLRQVKVKVNKAQQGVT